MTEHISFREAKESESGLTKEERTCKQTMKGELQDIGFKEEILWRQNSRFHG